MTPAQADKIIRNGSFIKVTDKYGDTGTIQITRREGRRIYCADGEAFDRTDIIKWEVMK